MKTVFAVFNEEGFLVDLFSSKEKAIELLPKDSYIKSVMGNTPNMNIYSIDNKFIEFVFSNEENESMIIYIGSDMNLDAIN